jgi:hypothetical protein
LCFWRFHVLSVCMAIWCAAHLERWMFRGHHCCCRSCRCKRGWLFVFLWASDYYLLFER